MKKQNSLIFSLISGMGIGLLSCIFENDDNQQTFYDTPAVIDSKTDMGGTVIGTTWGYLAAPELVDVTIGDCIYIHNFLVDYNNQPSDNYFMASGINKENVGQSNLDIRFTDELDEYTLPISYMEYMSNDFFKGRLFTGIACKDNNPSYRLFYNPIEEETNGIINLYLQAMPSSSTENPSDVSIMYAFNLSPLIQYFGKDTIKSLNGSTEKYEFRYIKANLHYVSSVTDGEPEYSMANNSNQPIEIYIFTEE